MDGRVSENSRICGFAKMTEKEPKRIKEMAFLEERPCSAGNKAGF